MKSLTTEKVRHLVVRADQADTLPDSLVTELRDQAVTCGFVRGSGVLRDVSLRAYSSELGGLAPPRFIAGPVHALSLEGSVGLSGGDISLGLRAVLGRETERGMETLAGELVSARVVGIELLVAAFDEHATPRALDPLAKIWLLGEGDPSKAPAVRREPASPAAFSEAIAASAATAATVASAERPRPPTPAWLDITSPRRTNLPRCQSPNGRPRMSRARPRHPIQ